MIYHYGTQYAYYLANTEPQDDELPELLAFLGFMDPEKQRGEKIALSIKKKEALGIKGRDTVRQFAGKLKQRAVELAQDSKTQKLSCIYLIMADKFVNLTTGQQKILQKAQNAKIDLDLESLYAQSNVLKK